jgi:hypothetical protein
LIWLADGKGVEKAAKLLQISTSRAGSVAAVISTLGKLARWPAPQLFPVLDIFRLLVLNAGTARLLSADAGELDPKNEGLGGLIARGLSQDSPTPTRLMALRLACNCCVASALRPWLLGHCDSLLDMVAVVGDTDSKPFRVALATLLLNIGVHTQLQGTNGMGEVRVRLVSLLHEV